MELILLGLLLCGWIGGDDNTKKNRNKARERRNRERRECERRERERREHYHYLYGDQP